MLKGSCLCAGITYGIDALPLGRLDTNRVRRTMHIHVGSKAPWHEIADALSRHEKWPPR
jgi:hypothetical protein